MHVESVSTHAPKDSIVVEDAYLLFTGDFKRTGSDLVISKDGHELVVPDYFRGEKRAPLASPDGAYLTGDLVNALAGHTQFAQADGSASVAKVIGHVTKMTGSATVIRNGVSIDLNLGDNVNKGDVVQAGSNSTLGITFVDGAVFGLGSNAKMVLNEMVYDPNGSSNSSLLSLVQGTISFVAGATAKHGDMKVDTPVATMGIRGTAMLIEIDFVVPATGGAPPTRFQMLLEPNGYSGSAVLLDKVTLLPIATVNMPGTQTSIDGQGVVSFFPSAQLSPEAQDIINRVFSLKFANSDPNSLFHFTDTPVPEVKFVQLETGLYIPITITQLSTHDQSSSKTSGPIDPNAHIPGPPAISTVDRALSEKVGLTGSSLTDTVSGTISYADINPSDIPTAKTTFASFTYQDAQHHDITQLTDTQLAAIQAVEVQLAVVQDPNNKNFGTATWTYEIADHNFDFLADGETLTLTYVARVDNNFAPANEFNTKTFTITITGTNDVPTITATSSGFTEIPGTPDHAGGTITFADVDLTDRPEVTTSFASYTFLDSQGNALVLTAEQLAAIDVQLTLTSSPSNANDGTLTWSYDVPAGTFAFMHEGESLTLTYTATVDDGHGGVVTTPITVNIPAPVIIERVGQTGDPQPDTISGAVAFADLSEIQDVQLASTSWSGGAVLPDGLVTVLTAALQTTVGSGNVHFTFSAPDNNFDFLAAGETLDVIYNVTGIDSQGLSSTKQVTITVVGTNDVPEITSSAQGATLSELFNTPAEPDRLDRARHRNRCGDLHRRRPQRSPHGDGDRCCCFGHHHRAGGQSGGASPSYSPEGA